MKNELWKVKYVKYRCLNKKYIVGECVMGEWLGVVEMEIGEEWDGVEGVFISGIGKGRIFCLEVFLWNGKIFLWKIIFLFIRILLVFKLNNLYFLLEG